MKRPNPNNLNGLFENRGGAPIYQIIFGELQHVPDPETLVALYGEGSLTYANTSLQVHEPSILLSGACLAKGSSDAIYLVTNGKKYHIASPDVLAQYNFWGTVYTVPDIIMNEVSTGEDITLRGGEPPLD